VGAKPSERGLSPPPPQKKKKEGRACCHGVRSIQEKYNAL